MCEEMGDSAENLDETDYETDEETLGTINLKTFKSISQPFQLYFIKFDRISTLGVWYGSE